MSSTYLKHFTPFKFQNGTTFWRWCRFSGVPMNITGIANPPGSKLSRTEQAKAICAVNYYGTRDVRLCEQGAFYYSKKATVVVLHLSKHLAESRYHFCWYRYPPLSCLCLFSNQITLSLAPFLSTNAKVVFVAARLGETTLKSMSEQNRKHLTAVSATLKVVCFSTQVETAPKICNALKTLSNRALIFFSV